MTPQEKPAIHEIARNWLLGAILILGVLTILKVASSITVPIVMAIFTAAVLRGPVRALMRLRLPQAAAAALVFVAFACALAGLIYVLYTPASQWVAEAPKLITKIERKMTPIKASIVEAQNTAEKLEHATDLGPAKAKKPEPVIVKEPSLLERAFISSRVFLVQVAVTVVLAFFMLAYPSPLIPDAIILRLGDGGMRIRRSLIEIESQMSRYMGTITAINIGLGSLTAVAMYACGMPSPLLWGVIAAFLGFVPYVGPVATAGIIGGVAFLSFDTWPAIIAPIASFLILHIIESEIVTPMIVGKLMMLHPVAIFIFVLVWSWMWGLAGSFLAVPILVAVVIAFRNILIEEDRTLSDFMLRAGGFHLAPPGAAAPL